jgi:hypothetical protein
VKLLLLSVWSDEYAQFEYRKKQYRIATLRILNAGTIEDLIIGAFPSGTMMITKSGAELCRDISL